MPVDPGTAGAFAIALGSIELAKVAIGWAVKKTNGYKPPVSGLTERQALQLHDLHQSHAPQVIELLKEIRDELRQGGT